MKILGYEINGNYYMKLVYCRLIARYLRLVRPICEYCWCEVVHFEITDINSYSLIPFSGILTGGHVNVP